MAKIRESAAKGPAPFIKGLAHSNLNHWLILVYFSPYLYCFKLGWFWTQRLSIKTHKNNYFPRRKVLRKMIMPGYVREAKMMVAKVPRKVLRKRYMSIMKWSLCFHHCSNTPSALPSLFRRRSLESVIHANAPETLQEPGGLSRGYRGLSSHFLALDSISRQKCLIHPGCAYPG